ncbi:hypothetical protein [Mycolicibacterium sp. J2]|uniref:hypothetical protein n=1 Tax=Mycolicibacterium sp. J2 TaxID=2993511 RepID=UPI00224B68DF|nr:hypothetical protein [Mycolicibacterium sp. J2]MCX2716110.1 hypothetical protein [Mycolicibacterium sp. J2]
MTKYQLKQRVYAIKSTDDEMPWKVVDGDIFEIRASLAGTQYGLEELAFANSKAFTEDDVGP